MIYLFSEFQISFPVQQADDIVNHRQNRVGTFINRSTGNLSRDDDIAEFKIAVEQLHRHEVVMAGDIDGLNVLAKTDFLHL